MNTTAPSIFESFNAKTLGPALVAQSFIPSAHYDVLAKRRHTVVVGPRGSGKTTLLKMLQQSALEAWDHPRADTYAARIDFTGVFVASDVSWGAQIAALGRGRLDDPEAQRTLGIAAFTTHVLRGVVNAMLGRARPSGKRPIREFRRVLLTTDREAELARGIAASWKLQPVIPSLLSVKHALGDRLLAIREVASAEVLRGSSGRAERLASMPGLHLHFLQAAEGAIDRFEDAVDEREGRWALLCDELELAPKWIREELVRSLRGAPERFLFKLAVAPYSEEFEIAQSPLGGAPGEDYDSLHLSYPEKRESYRFAEELWYGMLRERGIEARDPRSVLGRSYFETPREDYAVEGTAYRPDSQLGRVFRRLAESDKSFRAYLEAKKIDPRHLDRVSAAQRAADVRKIGPVVVVREFFRTEDDAKLGDHARHVRSRKTQSLYAGAESLFAITEGNPRLFIGMIGAILDKWTEDRKTISRGIQADEIARATERFSALIRTIPLPVETFGRSSRGLLGLLNTVGRYFHRAAVADDFVAEPVGSFTVDSHAPPALLAALGAAINAGAIVYLPDSDAPGIMISPRGKRFRLSYLFAPTYGLPIRIGKPVSLGRILDRGEPAQGAQLSLDAGA